MEMNLEVGILLGYAFGILLLYLIGYILLVPIRIIGKLFFNSFLGGVAILILNLFGDRLDLHIPLNLFTSVTVGILGLPGAAMLLFLERF